MSLVAKAAALRRELGLEELAAGPTIMSACAVMGIVPEECWTLPQLSDQVMAAVGCTLDTATPTPTPTPAPTPALASAPAPAPAAPAPAPAGSSSSTSSASNAAAAGGGSADAEPPAPAAS
eukprot:6839651-Prymnesium_polylepis.1